MTVKFYRNIAFVCIQLFTSLLFSQNDSGVTGDVINPTLTLTDTDSDNIVSNSDVVTITASFSESMAATPTISLSGIVSNLFMNATSSTTIWTYTWTVSSSLTSTTATISGTDLAGNSYTGTDTLSFILTEENLVFHYDASNLLSYNKQPTSASNNTVIDLSGNGNDGFISGYNHLYYDSSEDAFYFNGNTSRDGNGLFIENLNYVTGNSDQIYKLTLEARVKLKSDTSNHQNDQRIILSFDRSSVFRWAIGSDQFNQSSGKQSFMFINTEGAHDVYDVGYNSDLRDNQWHDVKITFIANQANGLKFYVDGQQTYSDPTVYSPIGNHVDNETPRYGVVGNGNEMDTQGGSTHPDDMFYGWIQKIKYYTETSDLIEPTLILSSSHSSVKVSNSSVVTITATFSESMAATPTISLTGIESNALMSATSTASIWTYTWSVSTTLTSTTATVSGTDLSGNTYSGTDSISFTIDNTPPEIKMTSPTGYAYVGYYNEHFYYINSGTSYGPKLNWSQANSAVNSLLTNFSLSTQKAEGGLLVIDSSDENDFIGSYLKNSYSYNSVWTGIYQDNDNSNWKNRLGENQTYFSWRSDQPSGTNQNVILFTSDPSVQGSNFASELNVWSDEEASNLNDYIVEIDNFYFEDNANSAMISFYTSMETLTWSLSGDDASFFEIDDSDQFGLAQTIFVDFKTSYKGNLTHTDPQDLNGDNIYKFVLSVSDTLSNTSSVVIKLKLLDTSSPIVTLTDTNSDNIVSNSEVVTITATFSERMTATPTISLTGIESNALMSATNSDSIWTYTWTVSGSTVSSTTATVSGTDLSGNAYSGTESLTFMIDSFAPTMLSFTDNDTDNTVNDFSNVTFTATFSEPMSTSPAISISGLVTNTSMTVSSSTNSSTWTYLWNVPAGSDGRYFATVSGTDLAGNPYAGTESLTFTIDNSAPTLILTDDDNDNIISNSDVVNITATFSESLVGTPTISLSGILSDALMSATSSDSVWNYTWTVSTSVDSVTATVSGTDIAGNKYSGSENITFGLRTIPNYLVKDGLIAWYPFNGNADDESGNLKHGQAKNNPTLTSDRFNNLNSAYDFDWENVTGYGSDWQRINLDHQFNLGSLFSINMWINPESYYWPTNSTKNSVIIANNADCNGTNFRLNLSTENNVDGIIVSSGSNNFGFAGQADDKASLDQWQMITLVVNGATAKIYKNGKEIAVSTSASYQLNGCLTIGLHHQSNGKWYYFDGEIDDVGIWSKALSHEEVVNLYNDTTSPTVTLTATDSDKMVSNSDVVTITATFSESMAATPTISLSGIESNALMNPTSLDSVWTYAWMVSTTLNYTTATVSGTDLAGNAYLGTDSLTFSIDNSAPTLVSLSENDEDNIVNNYSNVTLTATFSEAMSSSPTISISGLVTNTAMTVSASTNSKTWTYLWDVPNGNDGNYYATVSATDLSGNSYSGTESITFLIDNTAPVLHSVTVTDTNSKLILTYNEPVKLYDSYYFKSNFTVTKSGGIANVNYTGYSFSNSDSNTIILDIIVSGDPTGDELIELGPSGASTLIDLAGNYALDYSDSNQTSNTVYLINAPPKFSATSVNSNNTSITIVFSESVTADKIGTELSNTDFTLTVGGGTAVLNSAVPTAISKTDSKTYVLATSYSSVANGTEVLTVTPVSSVVFDSRGTQIVLSKLSSNTVQLNDQEGPTITGTTIDSQNRYVDITFNDGVYSTASPTTAVTSSSFTLSQKSGPSYGMMISSITTLAGTTLSGGESTLRFNLDAGGIKSTGKEVFMVTATDSTSVVDASGNSMSVSQTNNTFQLKPPTSGGVSTEKSTITIAPAEMIADGINTAMITVQTKDSLGQKFFEGGYQITIFGPDGDLTTIDNQNGTYSTKYTPEIITQDELDLTFGFRVVDEYATASALLKLYLDEDGDGIYNIMDACLGTEASLGVDATGCALNQLDSDNDGVFDDIDECPDTPELELNNIQGTPTYGELIKTLVDEKGCGASQRDTDEDGIVDSEDNCIDTLNTDQADSDGDGIGDVCDTDNPIPQITSTVLNFVQLPSNGTVVGKIDATDPEGEALTFTQTGDNFSGILSIASDGSVSVSLGALLSFDSTYNGAQLSFILSDGENKIPGSITIEIEDAPRPPEISIITFEVSEDAEVGTLVGLVDAKDPMGGAILSIALSGDGFIELLDNNELRTTRELDYETTTAHAFTITAQGEELTGSKEGILQVIDIPNTTYSARFFISIFNTADETLGSKVDHRRYYNPHNKNVGKWKVKKKIKGGADAEKFTIRSRTKEEPEKNGDPVPEGTEDYLDFINPPDFENPGDANKDNIYEVDIEYINTNDGAPEVPIVVTQTNIQAPEGKSTAIELQSQPVLPTDDNDGDGIVDILDNSPLVANPDQTDLDGDGVGDVTDDFDHDGVWNPFDVCPDTPLGELVDLEGCLIFYLPAKNFSISKTEKCIGENSITIDVVDTTVSYNVTVSGGIAASEVFTGNSWSIDGLSAGVFSICISVEGVNPLEFERCFEVTIEEPDPLVVSSIHNKSDQTVSFDLNGGSTYNITQNGKTTQTNSSKYTLQLVKGINNISISTGIECQGLFENTYLNSFEVKYAPNPFEEQLQLFIGGKDNLVEISVYSSNGQLIDYQTVSLSFGMRYYSLNTNAYKQGVYIIKVKGQTLDQTIQVIKE